MWDCFGILQVRSESYINVCVIAVNYNLLFDTTLSVTSIYVVTYAHIDRAK